MDPSQLTPLKITKTGSTIHRLLEEIDDKIIQFTNFPTDTPSLAQHIQEKIGFTRNLLSAELSSNGTKPHHLSEFEGRLTELEALFYQSNVRPANVRDGSESCMNDDRVDALTADDAPEMLDEVVVPKPEVCCESAVPVSSGERVECKGGGKRRWWRMVVTTVSAGFMVSIFSYFVNNNQHGEFFIPT